MDICFEDIGVVPLLYKVVHKCIKQHNMELKDIDISAPQAGILGVIDCFDNGNVNQKTLSETFDIKESSVSSIIKTMIKNDFIYKEQSKTDGRNYILKQTEKGKEISKKLKEKSEEFENRFFESLNEDERKELKDLLLKLI